MNWTFSPGSVGTAALLALLASTAGFADGPPMHPVYAHVLEGDAVDLPWRDGFGPTSIDVLGVSVEEGLDVAWSEYRAEALRLVFRSAASAPRVVHDLVVTPPGGEENRVSFGAITVAPTPAPAPPGLVTTFVADDGEGALLRTVRIENHGGRALQLRALSFAPASVARGPLIALFTDPSLPESGLVGRLSDLRADLAEQLPDARSAPPAATEAALRTLLPEASFVDPAALALELVPGGAVDLLLTRANFDVDLQTVRVVSTLLLHGTGPDGSAWVQRLSTPITAGVGR